MFVCLLGRLLVYVVRVFDDRLEGVFLVLKWFGILGNDGSLTIKTIRGFGFLFV